MSRIRRLYPQELAKIAQAHRSQEVTGQLTRTQLPSVTIVILSLDRLHLTRRCLESIYAHSDYPFSLLILDNGSQPDTIAYLRVMERIQDNLRVIYHPTNLGCAGGRNRAFSEVETDYALVLDNDVVCHPGWLRETMACAMRHDAAFVAPMRLDTCGQVWALGVELVPTDNERVLEIARWFHDLPVATVQQLLGDGDLTTNYISGCVGLYAVDAFHTCEGFREIFQAGFEDMDFSLCLTKRGYTIWAPHRAMVTHDDEWRPQTESDVQYVRERYDIARLQRDAALFRELWDVEVFPDKYIRAFQTRVQRKLENA